MFMKIFFKFYLIFVIFVFDVKCTEDYNLFEFPDNIDTQTVFFQQIDDILDLDNKQEQNEQINQEIKKFRQARNEQPTIEPYFFPSEYIEYEFSYDEPINTINTNNNFQKQNELLYKMHIPIETYGKTRSMYENSNLDKLGMNKNFYDNSINEEGNNADNIKPMDFNELYIRYNDKSENKREDKSCDSKYKGKTNPDSAVNVNLRISNNNYAKNDIKLDNFNEKERKNIKDSKCLDKKRKISLNYEITDKRIINNERKATLPQKKSKESYRNCCQFSESMPCKTEQSSTKQNFSMIIEKPIKILNNEKNSILNIKKNFNSNKIAKNLNLELKNKITSLFQFKQREHFQNQIVNFDHHKLVNELKYYKNIPSSISNQFHKDIQKIFNKKNELSDDINKIISDEKVKMFDFEEEIKSLIKKFLKKKKLLNESYTKNITPSCEKKRDFINEIEEENKLLQHDIIICKNCTIIINPFFEPKCKTTKYFEFIKEFIFHILLTKNNAWEQNKNRFIVASFLFNNIYTEKKFPEFTSDSFNIFLLFAAINFSSEYNSSRNTCESKKQIFIYYLEVLYKDNSNISNELLQMIKEIYLNVNYYDFSEKIKNIKNLMSKFLETRKIYLELNFKDIAISAYAKIDSFLETQIKITKNELNNTIKGRENQLKFDKNTEDLHNAAKMYFFCAFMTQVCIIHDEINIKLKTMIKYIKSINLNTGNKTFKDEMLLQHIWIFKIQTSIYICMFTIFYIKTENFIQKYIDDILKYMDKDFKFHDIEIKDKKRCNY